jgi:uncharacterized protein YybS (DUF2232 family)
MFALGAVLPVVGGFLMLLAPAPVLGCSVGFPEALWRAVAVALVAGAAIVFLGGIAAGVAYLVTMGAAAVVMAYMLERRQPFERIVTITTALVVGIGAVAAMAYAGSPQALAEVTRTNLTTAIVHGQKFYSMAGLDLGLSADLRGRMIETTLKLMPALLVISIALMALMNLAVFWRVSGRQRRLGYQLFGDLVRWTTPEWLIWVLLVTGFGLFIPSAALSTSALDCFICVAAIYFCQGLAIMAFYFRLLSMPSLARGLVYTITAVQPVLAVLVCVAGVFDLWIDFRRLKPPSSEARNLGDTP